MNPILLEIGFFRIYWYSLAILVGATLGCYIFYKEAIKRGLTDKFLEDLIFGTVLSGIIGARIYYCLFEIGYFINNPLEILAIWNGGLAIHGGIIFGAAFIIYYSKKHKVNFLKIFDMAAPGLILAQAIGRWGNFFNGEAHGPEVTRQVLEKLLIPGFVIDGMNILGVYYHPTFYYEFLWNLLGFIVLIILRKKKKFRNGTLTGIYFMHYSFARFFIELMRTDSLMIGPIKVAMLVSAILFILGAFLVFYKEKDSRVKRLTKGEHYEN